MLSGASVELKTCNAALLEATGKSWDEVGFQYLAQLHTVLSSFKLIHCLYCILCAIYINDYLCLYFYEVSCSTNLFTR